MASARCNPSRDMEGIAAVWTWMRSAGSCGFVAFGCADLLQCAGRIVGDQGPTEIENRALEVRDNVQFIGDVRSR